MALNLLVISIVVCLKAVNFYTQVFKLKPESVAIAPFIPTIKDSKYLPLEKIIGIGLLRHRIQEVQR